jgi:hypothetical protein
MAVNSSDTLRSILYLQWQKPDHISDTVDISSVTRPGVEITANSVGLVMSPDVT